MIFSLFRVKYVPIHTGFDINRAWVVQDTLLANGIKANIEVEPCDKIEICQGKLSYSVCVPGKKANEAKKIYQQ